MNSDLTIHRYTSEAIPAVLDLIRQTLGGALATRKTAEFWDWKHQANPFGPSYGLYAWDDTEQIMAGLRVLMRWGFTNPDGLAIQAVRAVDTATHPAYRRRGIFSNLTETAVEELTAAGLHLIFNTPNRHSLPGYLKLGWQVVEAWPLFIKILRPIRLATNLARRNNGTAALPALDEYFGPGVMAWPTFVERYQQEISSLIVRWEFLRAGVGFRTPRDLTYLAWRYGHHPHIPYGLCPLEDAEKLVGFAVLRPNVRYGLKEIVLTELFLHHADLKLGQRLLAQLVRQLKADYLIAHFAADTFERKLLNDTGFWRVPRRGIVFTARSLNLPRHEVLDPTAWDLSLGDLELF